MRTFSVCLCLVLLATFASAEIYRWVDENGHVTFSDKSRHARDAHYVPKTALSSYDGGHSSKALGEKSINTAKENSFAARKNLKRLKRAENFQAGAEKSSLGRAPKGERQAGAGIRSSTRGTKAIVKRQALHDRQTNYDGYGSELSRYQNAIIMKTHNSVIKGGNMEYWNGLDDYYYKGRYRGKASRHRW